MRAGQVVAAQRVLLDADEDDPLAACRVLPPGVPGGEEVVAQAEARLQHDEALAALEVAMREREWREDESLAASINYALGRDAAAI